MWDSGIRSEGSQAIRGNFREKRPQSDFSDHLTSPPLKYGSPVPFTSRADFCSKNLILPSGLIAQATRPSYEGGSLPSTPKTEL